MTRAQQPVTCKNGHLFCLQCISHLIIGPGNPTWQWDLACQMDSGDYVQLKQLDNKLGDLCRRLNALRSATLNAKRKLEVYAHVKPLPDDQLLPDEMLLSGMIKISPDIIDLLYISQWAARLGLENIWREIQKQVSKRKP